MPDFSALLRVEFQLPCCECNRVFVAGCPVYVPLGSASSLEDAIKKEIYSEAQRGGFLLVHAPTGITYICPECRKKEHPKVTDGDGAGSE